jgi:hypothetical protein
MSSTSPQASANGSATDAPAQSSTNPELDVAKLQALPAEQQDLYLLTYVSSLKNHVVKLSDDDCTAQQFYLKKEIFQILNLPAPIPSRVTRTTLGTCLAQRVG